MKRKILVVVDMQKDFIDGVLGTKEAVAIVGNVCNKINECRKNGYDIIFTRDTHYADNYENTQEGQKLPVLHCVKDTDGWQINADVEKVKRPEDVVYDKETFGCVTLARNIMRDYNNGRSDFNNVEVELVGLCTDICVISNAMLIKNFMPNITVVVDGNCCAGVTVDSHNTALNAMRMVQIEVR